jgi:hypothetical protein
MWPTSSLLHEVQVMRSEIQQKLVREADQHMCPDEPLAGRRGAPIAIREQTIKIVPTALAP